jgi:hypothetical protein
VLPVHIAYRGRGVALEAIVDSGADRSSFPAALADYLSIPSAARTPITVSGVTGTTATTGPDTAFAAQVLRTVQGRDIPSNALFIPNGQHFLLGRADVFSTFLFGFDQRRQHLLLTPLPRAARP